MRTALLASLLVLGVTAPALAHFKLMSPASLTAQDTIGDPQKGAPCGPNGAPVETGPTTPLMTGSMMAVTVDETVDHPGHYRVAIAQDLAGLPAAPIVTGANCGMTTIQTTPVMPVLADGLFSTLTSAQGSATAMVQLPAGFTCTNCIVQVIEFMSAHSTPCFYYHCARVTISDNPVIPDGPPTGGPDAGTNPPGSGNVDGGCSATDGSGLAGTALLAGLLALRRRRR